MPEEEINEEEHDEETILAINRAEAQIDRGEFLLLDEARAQMREMIRRHQAETRPRE